MRLRDQVIGSLNLLGAVPGTFDAAGVRIGQALTDIATISLPAHLAIDAPSAGRTLNIAAPTRPADGIISGGQGTSSRCSARPAGWPSASAARAELQASKVDDDRLLAARDRCDARSIAHVNLPAQRDHSLTVAADCGCPARGRAREPARRVTGAEDFLSVIQPGGSATGGRDGRPIIPCPRRSRLGWHLVTGCFARYPDIARLSRLVSTGPVIVFLNHSRPRWHSLVRPEVARVRDVAAEE
jgi:hypothetical protein